MTTDGKAPRTTADIVSDLVGQLRVYLHGYECSSCGAVRKEEHSALCVIAPLLKEVEELVKAERGLEKCQDCGENQIVCCLTRCPKCCPMEDEEGE